MCWRVAAYMEYSMALAVLCPVDLWIREACVVLSAGICKLQVDISTMHVWLFCWLSLWHWFLIQPEITNRHLYVQINFRLYWSEL